MIMNIPTFLPLGFIGTWELVMIVLVVLLLFGGRKIPELMRGLGKGVKEFKNGMDEVEKTIKDTDRKEETPKVLEPDKIERPRKKTEQE